MIGIFFRVKRFFVVVPMEMCCSNPLHGGTSYPSCCESFSGTAPSLLSFLGVHQLQWAASSKASLLRRLQLMKTGGRDIKGTTICIQSGALLLSHFCSRTPCGWGCRARAHGSSFSLHPIPLSPLLPTSVILRHTLNIQLCLRDCLQIPNCDTCFHSYLLISTAFGLGPENGKKVITWWSLHTTVTGIHHNRKI